MRKKYLIIAGIIIVALIFVKFTLNFWISIMPQCLFFKVTGLYCPGCGGTRSVIALLNGNIWTAFKYNPGVVSLAIITGLVLFEKIFNKKILPRRLSFWGVFIIMLFFYYIIRNLL